MNPDGTAGVALSPVDVAGGSGLIASQSDLATSFGAFRAGFAPRPMPIRCSGALYLADTFGEPMPPGKCDSGLRWAVPSAGYPAGGKTWATVSGTTGPMNQYMMLPASGINPFVRTPGEPIRSETYIFMWEPNHALRDAAIGGAPGEDRTSLGVASASTPNCTVNDSPNHAFNNISSLKWCGSGKPASKSPRSLMYMWGASIAISAYRITSAADFSTRDPKTWTFQGCDGTCSVSSDTGWVTLDTRSNQSFSARLQSKTFNFSNSTAYSQYRLRITANASNDSHTQLREVQLYDGGGPVVPLAGVDRTENGTVTWTGKPCSTAELPTRAFDNLLGSAGATRWCVTGVPSATRPVSVVYQWDAAPPAVTSYTIISASDYAARDPRSWTLQGCNGSCTVGADAGWVTLDTRSAQTFGGRLMPNAYAFTNSTAYAQYRLRVTANNGDTSSLQLGELLLY